VVIERLRPVTVPFAALGTPPAPIALPTATTASPTETVPVSVVTGVRPDAPLSCSTAMSSTLSVPTTVATYLSPVDTTITLIFVAPSTTWLLVRISPSDVRIMPVPAAFAPRYLSRVLMSTTPTCWLGVAWPGTVIDDGRPPRCWCWVWPPLPPVDGGADGGAVGD